MTAFYHTRLYFKDIMFVENYVDHLGVEHSIVPPVRPDIERYARENWELQRRVNALEHQKQYLLQGFRTQQHAYTTQLLAIVEQLNNVKASFEASKSFSKVSQQSHSSSVMDLFSSVSASEHLPETPWDAVELSEVEKGAAQGKLPQKNSIHMLSTMDNIQQQQPGAETPWDAIEVSHLEKVMSVDKIQRRMA